MIPELARIRALFEKARYGLSFDTTVKQQVGERLKRLITLPHFEQLLELLQIFQVLATSHAEVLNEHVVAKSAQQKDQDRISRIYHFVEEHYRHKVDVKEAAALTNLTTAAFCRYFKKITRMTFTDFVNQYRITQSKRLLLQGSTVTEACYESGFDNLSYFNKTFRKLVGENPSRFKRTTVSAGR